MNYHNFDLIDFVLDEFFQEWVINPTEESTIFWNDWIGKNQQKKQIIEQAKAIIQNVNFESINVTEFDKGGVLDNINAMIRTDELTNELKVSRETIGFDDDEVNETVIYSLETKREKIKIWYRAAAVIFIVAAIGISAFLLDRFNQATTQIVYTDEFVEKSCGPGEKLNVKLADGTRVKLNSNSKLIIPRMFSENERKVILVGEAFFDVTKDVSRPFIISSDQITTVVHGTSFNVRAFSHEPDIKVAVAEGRVSVETLKTSNKDQVKETLLLNPSEMAVFEKATHETEKVKFDFVREIGWKDGIIYFENADIHEVLQTLENWYGVTFIKNGQINEDKDYTGSFDKKSLEVVLEGLGYVFDFRYEIKGKIILLN
ncbi:FecR domain-containing protein [Fulvivirgaceae bacterium BMA10]|uniref:FecR domain-containing protein n=1 Tax=Splendidivirga corallicola TaxID=3051826 RepID=A0ABT8KN25_9BACT|nr:FecR domain-containing protein [Fulvivirgaceae bacterium BMA10]